MVDRDQRCPGGGDRVERQQRPFHRGCIIFILDWPDGPDRIDDDEPEAVALHEAGEVCDKALPFGIGWLGEEGFIDEGDMITFTGTADDVGDGDLSASIDWSSDLDGFIGTGASVPTSALRVGVHTITAEAADVDNATGSDSIGVTIQAVGGTGDAVVSDVSYCGEGGRNSNKHLSAIEKQRRQVISGWRDNAWVLQDELGVNMDRLKAAQQFGRRPIGGPQFRGQPRRAPVTPQTAPRRN